MAITNVKEYDILPSRMDYFEARMEKLSNAAAQKIPPIEFHYSKLAPATRPLPTILIPRAMNNQIPDARQLPNGDWVRNVIPVKIEYGDLINPKFDYIGFVNYGSAKNTAGDLKKGIFPTIVKDAAMSDEEHEKRVAKMTPVLQAIGDQWTSTKSVKCDICNPKGDNVGRHTAYIVQAKDDVKQHTKKSLKGNIPPLDLKKGQILQLGSACLSDFMGLDVDKIAAFYELDRQVGSYGPNGSPSNPAGWGYKEMGIWDYCERMVMFYGQREREWLAGKRKSLWEIKDPTQIYSHGTLSNLIQGKGKDGEGCFIGASKDKAKFTVAKAVALLRGRMFNLYENDPTQTPQWMFQPLEGKTGSMQSFGWQSSQGIWLQGMNTDFEYKKVMVVNESDGTPIIDEVTGDIKEIEIKYPSSSYIQSKLRGWRSDWALKIVPVLPPASDSDFVKQMQTRMIDWIKNLDTTTSEYRGQADLLERLKATAKIGYVGIKTVREAPQIWKMFSLHDFKRRQKADYKSQRKQVKKTIGDKINADGKWFTVPDLADWDKNPQMYSYLNKIYNYRERNLAYQTKYDMVYMTQDQWDAFPAWKAKEEADRKAKELLRKKREDYSRIVNRIRSTGYHNRAYMRKVNYNPDIVAFLALLGWDELGGDMEMLKQYGTGLVRVNTDDDVVQAYLTDSQLDKVNNAFRPTLVQPSISQPTATPPTTAVTKTQNEPAITPADAKKKMWALRNAGKPDTHAHNVGAYIKQVGGWVLNVSRPFYRKGMAGQGRTITMVTPNDTVYVIFYYGQNLPQVGEYYNLFDVEVKQHTQYPPPPRQGIKQLVIEDIDGGQVQFELASS